jgi:hypothetical protein
VTRVDEKELTTLLEQWEGVFKKGLLTFWVLLLLHERPMYVFEMGEALETVSRGTMTADERSLYRALLPPERVGHRVAASLHPAQYLALSGVGYR